MIKTEEENERLLTIVESMMAKQLSPEESKLLDLLVKLIEDFEEKCYPIPDALPHEVLQHLMEQKELKQSDLISIFASRGYISDVVNGKRAISKNQAKKLGEFFHVSPAVFI